MSRNYNILRRMNKNTACIKIWNKNRSIQMTGKARIFF
jgi:hypothetical protein